MKGGLFINSRSVQQKNRPKSAEKNPAKKKRGEKESAKCETPTSAFADSPSPN
jgi:hypothetical protein